MVKCLVTFVFFLTSLWNKWFCLMYKEGSLSNSWCYFFLNSEALFSFSHFSHLKPKELRLWIFFFPQLEIKFLIVNRPGQIRTGDRVELGAASRQCSHRGAQKQNWGLSRERDIATLSACLDLAKNEADCLLDFLALWAINDLYYFRWA
jgi:hypothetical protein